jgi:hypothetical protein
VASARSDETAATLVGTARQRALDGGHLVSADVLASITGASTSRAGRG